MEFSEIKKKLGGKRSRAKGLDFERKIAEMLRPIFPDAKRHLEFQKADCIGVDLDNTGPYRIQCKKLKKYAPISCIEEVKCHDWLGEIPVLITAAIDKPPLVVLPLEEWIRLIGVDNECE